MLFSLIVPFYNVELYITKCLESIDAQICRDFEVVLVDDGSLDYTRSIVDSFIATKGNQYKLITQENRGLSAARNTAMQYAEGQYLVFLDSDDWIEPDYLSSMASIIQEYRPDIIRCKWYENSDLEMVCGDVPGGAGLIDKEQTLRNILLDRYAAQVWKNVYNSQLWKNVSFPEGLLYEDLYTTHFAFASAKMICYCNQPFYHYMIRPGSISTAPKFGRAKGIYFGYKTRYMWICERKEYHDMRPALLTGVLRNLLQYVHECVKFQNELCNAKKECREMLAMAKNESFRIPIVQRLEIALFLRTGSFYQKAFLTLKRLKG